MELAIVGESSGWLPVIGVKDNVLVEEIAAAHGISRVQVRLAKTLFESFTFAAGGRI
jgi:hypothetical protein